MDKERKIRMIRSLRKNARKTLASFAREENVATSTVFSDMKRIEKYIKKHTCLLKAENIGFPFQAVLYCETTKEEKETIIANIQKIKNINNCYSTSNNNLIIELISTSLDEEEEAENWCKEKCNKIEKYAILKKLVYEKWLP